MARNTQLSIAETTQRFFPQHEGIIERLPAFAKKYADKKREASVLDYDDLLELWLELLKKSETTREYFSHRFRHVLVDEYQDTNVVQSQIVDLIARLVANGLAYPSDGDVYYRVARFAAYGALSKRSLDDMQAGARVEINERKESPLDFVLWKGAKPGEPQWDSPWGPGRPGWHIECSAMSLRHLGESFDLHGGGR